MTQEEGEREAERLAEFEERARWANVVAALRSAARQYQSPPSLFHGGMLAADYLDALVVERFGRVEPAPSSVAPDGTRAKLLRAAAEWLADKARQERMMAWTAEGPGVSLPKTAEVWRASAQACELAAHVLLVEAAAGGQQREREDAIIRARVVEVTEQSGDGAGYVVFTRHGGVDWNGYPPGLVLRALRVAGAPEWR